MKLMHAISKDNDLLLKIDALFGPSKFSMT